MAEPRESSDASIREFLAALSFAEATHGACRLRLSSPAGHVAAVQQLDRHALAHFVTDTFADIHGSHSAASGDLQQSIRSALQAKEFGVRKRANGRDADTAHEKRTRARREQRFYLPPGVVRRCRAPRKIGCAYPAADPRRGERTFDLRVPPAISLCSDACAGRSSRRTKRTEIDNAAADSSAVIPPK
jgi:hypothetical protein